MAARLTGVVFPCIFFLFPLKQFFCEVLFRFERPFLLMADAIGAAVSGGTGARPGTIYCGSMYDILEGQKWFHLKNIWP